MFGMGLGGMALCSWPSRGRSSPASAHRRWPLGPARHGSCAKWDRALIAAMIAMQAPLDRTAPLFPSLRRTLYRGPSRESVVMVEETAAFTMPELAPGDESAFSSVLRDGVLVAESAGTYRISVDSDDGSFVAVDGKLQQSANPAPPPILRKNGEGAAATIARDA